MRRLLLLSALLGVTTSGFSVAQTQAGPASAVSSAATPAISVVPALPASALTELPPPRLSSSGGVTRVVLDLPAAASYTLAPTFTGLRLDLRGVTGRAAASTQPTAELGGWSLGVDGAGGVVVTLTTPFPLGLTAGWRAFELPAVQGDGHRLVLEFGATLQGGASSDLAARVLTVAPATAPLPVSADPLAGSDTQGVSTAALSSSVLPNTTASSNSTVSPNSIVPGSATSGRSLGGSTPLPPPPTAAQPNVPSVSGAPLAAPRLGKYPGYTRLVLDLPSGVTYTAAPGAGGLSVALRGVKVIAASVQGVSPEVAAWRLNPLADGATLTVATPYPLGALSGWHAQLLAPGAGSDHPRLVLDFSPAFANLTPLAPAQRALAPIPPDTLRRASLPAGTAAAVPGPPLPVRVVLDPGHGGSDPGAIGAVVEKATTLQVALRVRDLLQAAGAEVVMSRTTDAELNPVKDTDLRLRGQLGSPPAALFVSIHVNSMEKNAVLRGYGVETWWMGNNAGSQSLATHLQQDVVALTGNFSRGLQTGRSLAVLRNARVPAALIEIGFTSHPVDGPNLQDTNYLDRVAVGIAQGIRDTLLDQ